VETVLLEMQPYLCISEVKFQGRINQVPQVGEEYEN